MGNFRENIICNPSLLWRYDEVIWEYTCLRRYFCATMVLLSALSVFVLYLPPNTPREGHLSLRTYFLYQWPSHIPLFSLPQLDNQKIFLEAFPISNPCQSARWPILRSGPSSFPVPLPCYCPPCFISCARIAASSSLIESTFYLATTGAESYFQQSLW